MAGKSSNYRERASSVYITPSINIYPTPPSSSSPGRSSFHRSNPFSSSPTNGRATSVGESNEYGNGKPRRRCISLCEKFPGDLSHRPLEQLRKEIKAANRSPHLKKKYLPGADTIDSLDKSAFGLSYHHGGPYDATLLARNRSRRIAPVEALKSSNNEALRATPREFIKASLERHLPLQGTAEIPPGMPGIDGHIMQYEEGADLMREADAEGGAYKRWPDMKYLPEDLSGKGEPSYSIEKALKKDQRRAVSSCVYGYEMQPLKASKQNNQRSVSGLIPDQIKLRASHESPVYTEHRGGRQRGLSTGQRVSEGLRRRFENFASRGKKVTGVMS